MGVMAVDTLQRPLAIVLIDHAAGVRIYEGRNRIIMATPAEVIGRRIVNMLWRVRIFYPEKLAISAMEVMTTKACDTVDGAMRVIRLRLGAHGNPCQQQSPHQ
jgi:hypothetical protein